MGSAKTHKKHTDLKSKINEILWDKTFYKSIHGEELLENPSFEKLPDCQNVQIENMHMGDSLMKLCYNLTQQQL